jgi:hypothetical protein
MRRLAALVALSALALAVPARADVRDGCTLAATPVAPDVTCSFAADGPIQWVSHGTSWWEIDVWRNDEYIEAYIAGGADSVGTWTDVRPGDVVRVHLWLPDGGAGVIDVRESL